MIDVLSTKSSFLGVEVTIYKSDNQVFLPYNSIETLCNYPKNSFLNKKNSDYMKKFFNEQNVEIKELKLVPNTTGTNYRKGLSLPDFIKLVKFEILVRKNKPLMELASNYLCKELNKALDLI